MLSSLLSMLSSLISSPLLYHRRRSSCGSSCYRTQEILSDQSRLCHTAGEKVMIISYITYILNPWILKFVCNVFYLKKAVSVKLVKKWWTSSFFFKWVDSGPWRSSWLFRKWRCIGVNQRICSIFDRRIWFPNSNMIFEHIWTLLVVNISPTDIFGG